MSWMMLAIRFSDKLPVWAIWTSTIWQVIGGGSNVMTVSMVYAMIADVQPAERLYVSLRFTYPVILTIFA